MNMPRVDALLNQLNKAKNEKNINFEFQRDNRHKFEYDFMPGDHIRVSFGRGGFAYFDRNANLISQETAGEGELAEAKKVIRDACAGSIGVAPPHYKGSAVNPDWVRWNEWIKSKQANTPLPQQPQSHQPVYDRTPHQ